MERKARDLLLQHPFLTSAQLAVALGVPVGRVLKEILPAVEGLRSLPLNAPHLPPRQWLYFIARGPKGEGHRAADVLLAYRQFAAIAIVYEV
ncbi:MAG: hypothetical protein D6796_17360, partial [Caldilineae bacterium]